MTVVVILGLLWVLSLVFALKFQDVWSEYHYLKHYWKAGLEVTYGEVRKYRAYSALCLICLIYALIPLFVIVVVAMVPLSPFFIFKAAYMEDGGR